MVLWRVSRPVRTSQTMGSSWLRWDNSSASHRRGMRAGFDNRAQGGDTRVRSYVPTELIPECRR
jgi:hypothetical protein